MPGRVFISCGQATVEERQIAATIKKWFSERGFEPYVAIQSQSLEDVKSAIINELKRSDFYVFIDFRRERVLAPEQTDQPSATHAHRGSLFTNQELAVAILLGFEYAIFLQQDEIKAEGLLQFVVSNAERFATLQEVPGIVERLVDARQWDSSYTRHLSLGRSHWAGPLWYVDHTGQHPVRVFEIDIHNRRQEQGALNAIARLRQITGPDGNSHVDVDQSALKITGQQGYAQVIWPGKHSAWDLFAVRMDISATICLNSALDVLPRQSVISTAGEYLLTYEVFAENFPVLRFEVRLSVSNDPQLTSAMLLSEAI